MTTSTDQAAASPTDDLFIGSEAGESRDWNWHPDIPAKISPLFEWPLRPLAIVNWFVATWKPLSEHFFYALLAVAVWHWLQPPLAETATLQAGWVFEIWLRNIVMMIVFTTVIHLWLYTYAKQGNERKFDRRGLANNNRTFAFNSQLLDNLSFTLISGVTVWTIYECLMWLAYGNGTAPIITFSQSPVWFFLAFVFIQIFQSLHFYWVHRFLHWPPLYRVAHAVHHRNVSVGPWSGFSMHPIEHVLYLSSLLIHLIVPTHPIHMLFHAYWLTLATATSHSGYESIVVNGKPRVRVGSFFHQLHHRYFECNYGNVEMPWDRWFGSYHDGTSAGSRRVREYKKAKMGA